MFRVSRAATLSPAMEAAPTDPTRARRAAHLVFGIDDRIAGTVFGLEVLRVGRVELTVEKTRHR